VGHRPIVGISEGFADYGDYYGFGYGRPLLAAGALPVLLPYYERAEDRVELLGRIDGLVLAGGRDVEAWRYGRLEPHAKHLPGQPHLDEIELHYARAAVEAGLPLLAICRGCQVLNVAFGGTLYGDLEEFPEGGADHPGAKWDEWHALVAATLEGRGAPHTRPTRSTSNLGRCSRRTSGRAPWSTAITIRRSNGSAMGWRPSPEPRMV
jgi:gamma-glutamyl-gamma-aminobutyrate hydrolase PuuD